jgi:POT family proton-dependent oligopeptide transporter
MSQSLKPHQKELFGHPIGLYVLFFTEMWERFSYYGMRAILVIYMIATAMDKNGAGLGWTKTEALQLYGWYVMLVYVVSIPGGILADKYLGQKKAVMLGAFILVLGHGVLAVDATWAFFTGLGLIILGVGCLKPNISTMVGGLYQKGDIRRDKGFSIFYIGINLGSLLATSLIGLVVAKWGWHAGFGMAGIAMLFGLLVYIWGQKYITHVGNKPTAEEQENDISLASIFVNIFKSPVHLAIMLVLLALSLYAGFTFEGVDHWGYGVLFIFLSLVVGLMMMIYKSLETQVEKDRFLVLLLSFFLVVVFWGAFEQAGGLMSIYTETKTNRMLFGYEIPTPMFQGLNAGFILLFAVWIANIWAKRKLKGKEASSLFKMATGTMIMGLGFVFMVFAVREYGIKGHSGMHWLVLAYLFHTIGELSSSPVSLSFVTKLAPVKYASLMMGLYFAATGLGGKVAGIIGEYSQLKSYEAKVLVGKDTFNKLVAKDTLEIYDYKTKKTFKLFDYPINKDKTFKLKTDVYLANDKVVFEDAKTHQNVNYLFKIENDKKHDNVAKLKNYLKENQVTKVNSYHADLTFKKDEEKAKIIANIGDGKDYAMSFVLDEQQSKQEFKTFAGITIFTVIFGLLVIALLKPLKRLTHGAEDDEHEIHDETEGFELADN